MSRITKLLENPKLKQAENTDFILRLRYKKEHDLPLKTDSINLSNQYVALYKALEDRLNEVINYNTLYLTIFNKEPWTDRSKQLKNDVIQMKTFLSSVERRRLINKETLFPAMKKMIDQIATADAVTLFAFLAVRCLGDVFVAQDSNGYNARLFSQGKLKGEFYNGVTKQTDSLSTFVSEAGLTESEEIQFEKDADYFIQLHIDLFNQMEQERAQPIKVESITRCLPQSSCKRYGLFALSALGAAAAVAGVYCSLVAP
jgi:CRISPR/Cas system CSM-associated protein Csm2 small subunit